MGLPPVPDRADYRRRHDQLVRESLMIAFTMVVVDELGDGPPKGPLADVHRRTCLGGLLNYYERAASRSPAD